MNSGMNAKTPESDEYETPPWLYDALHAEFDFTLDPCCTHATAKCKKHYTVEEDGLAQPWIEERVFCNPPYSQVERWVGKAIEAVALGGSLVVLLLPVRTDNDWWAKLWALMQARGSCEMRFLRKRVRFLLDGKLPLNPKTGKPSSPRFASVVVVLR